jgi:hypothetical protein
MQIARPDINLLADIPGGIETESHLHQRFQKFHITGEWFHFAPEIREFVKEQPELNAPAAPQRHKHDARWRAETWRREVKEKWRQNPIVRPFADAPGAIL